MRVRKYEREDYRRQCLGIGEYAPPGNPVIPEPESSSSKKKTSFTEQMFDFVNRSGKTPKEIADHIEVDVHTVRAWMNGKNLPLKYQLGELEEYLNATFSPRPICIKDAVNYFMKKNELSVKDFCELTGLSIGQFRCMANANRLTSYENILKLAEALGVDIDYFYDYEKEEENPMATMQDYKPGVYIDENKFNNTFTFTNTCRTFDTTSIMKTSEPPKFEIDISTESSMTNDEFSDILIAYFFSDILIERFTKGFSGVEAYRIGSLINLLAHGKVEEAKECISKLELRRREA